MKRGSSDICFLLSIVNIICCVKILSLTCVVPGWDIIRQLDFFFRFVGQGTENPWGGFLGYDTSHFATFWLEFS